MKNPRAFTLAETMVAMVISSIAILLAYGAFLLTTKNYLAFKTTDEEFGSLSQMQNWLTLDVEKCTSCRWDGRQLILDDRSSGEITYTMDNHQIIRMNDEHSDTCNLSIVEWDKFFCGRQVMENEISLVDHLIIKCQVQGKPLQFMCKKWYGADQLMMNDTAQTIDSSSWRE